MREFAHGKPKVITSDATSSIAGSIGSGEWAQFAKFGAFFWRHLRDQDGDLYRERVRVWCDGTYIRWCDAKLPKNTADSSRQINFTRKVGMFLGNSDDKVYYTEDATVRNCITIVSRHATLAIEADTYDDRQMWWAELKRYVRANTDITGGSSTPRRMSTVDGRRPSISQSRRGSSVNGDMSEGGLSDVEGIDRGSSSGSSGRKASMDPVDAAMAASMAKRGSIATSSTSLSPFPSSGPSSPTPASPSSPSSQGDSSSPEQGTMQHALRDLYTGTPFKLFAEDDDGKVVGIPITLFIVQNALHPPPGAVYWIEQDNPGGLEQFPDRRLDIKTFVKVGPGVLLVKRICVIYTIYY